MSGSRKCPTCDLRYVGQCDRACWLCLNGYDPRGPFVKAAP
jgi:hypothetical protein